MPNWTNSLRKVFSHFFSFYFHSSNFAGFYNLILFYPDPDLCLFANLCVPLLPPVLGLTPTGPLPGRWKVATRYAQSDSPPSSHFFPYDFQSALTRYTQPGKSLLDTQPNLIPPPLIFFSLAYFHSALTRYNLTLPFLVVFPFSSSSILI